MTCTHERMRVGEVEIDSKGLLTGRVGTKCPDCKRVWSPAEAEKFPRATGIGNVVVPR